MISFPFKTTTFAGILLLLLAGCGKSRAPRNPDALSQTQSQTLELLSRKQLSDKSLNQDLKVMLDITRTAYILSNSLAAAKSSQHSVSALNNYQSELLRLIPASGEFKSIYPHVISKHKGDLHVKSVFQAYVGGMQAVDLGLEMRLKELGGDSEFATAYHEYRAAIVRKAPAQ